jgi:serine/threonine protein kinase
MHSFLGSVKYLPFGYSCTDLSSGHRDVKPASVLVLSYGAESAFDWQFKLADFGLGHPISKATSEEGPIANSSRGTQTYGV